MKIKIIFIDIYNLFQIIFEFFKLNKIAIYIVRPRFGQAASGIPLFLTELSKFKKKPKTIIISFSNNIFFNEYLKQNSFIFIKNKRVGVLFNNLINRLNLNYLKIYNDNYFKNEVNEFNKIVINYNLIDKIIKENNYPKLPFNYDLNKKYICLSIKEIEYYKTNTIYDNYNHPKFEFDTIERFKDVISFYVKSGYNVIRMGRGLNPASFDIEGFFDYGASSFTSDINDVILSKNCEFVLSNQTGFDFLPAYWFSKPIYLYQIRSYRFLIETFPFRIFNPIRANLNNCLLNYTDILNFETNLWKNNDQNKLHEILSENGIEYLPYSSELILESAIYFLSDYESIDLNLKNLKPDNITSDFWNSFNECINPVYSNLNRPLSKNYNYNRPNLKFLK